MIKKCRCKVNNLDSVPLIKTSFIIFKMSVLLKAVLNIYWIVK